MGVTGNEAAIPPFRTLEAEGSREDLERGMVAMSVNDPPLAEGRTCVVEGAVTIRGWAHARGGIDSVLVVVDGKRFEALRPIVRTDLLEHYGRDAATEAGFVLWLHPSECPPGRHRIAVVAIGCDGDTVGVEGDLECRVSPLETDSAPEPVATVDWIERRTTPSPFDAEAGADLEPPAAPLSPDQVKHLHGLALMWESRALLAEADAAASRVEAGLASVQQEAAIRMLRAAEARLRELEAELARRESG